MPPKRKAGQNENVELIQPVKLPDGAPLLRQNLQSDFLAWVFSNFDYRFTPPQYPNETTPLFPMDRMWTFAELYLDCVANSSKAPKALREKMAESQDFAVAYAKVCLMVNLNRLNTTHAFFLECRTLNRTYHSLPSLQLHEFTRKNLPDAPRLKAQLKACILPQEKLGSAEKLRTIAEAAKTKTPPTTVVNLIFAVINDAAFVSEKYLAPGQTLSDVLCSNMYSSKQRAEAFLFILHRLLETPSVAQDWDTPGRIGDFVLQATDTSHENQDTEEEIAWGQSHQEKRAEFVAQLKAGAPQSEPAQVEYVDASKATRSATAARGGSPFVDDWVPGSAAPSHLYENGHVSNVPHGHVALEDEGARVPSEEELYWSRYIDGHVHSQHDTLHYAYQRAKYEHDNNIDPLYESEDDDADAAKHGWTLSEVRQRVNVFTLPAGGPDEKAKTVVYKGSSIRPAVLRPIEPLPPSAAPGAIADEQAGDSNAPSPSSEPED